jgi:hypothetical protein
MEGNVWWRCSDLFISVALGVMDFNLLDRTLRL